MTRICCVLGVSAAERMHRRLAYCDASPVYLGYAPGAYIPSSNKDSIYESYIVESRLILTTASGKQLPAEKPRRGCVPEKRLIRPPCANLRTALRMPSTKQAKPVQKELSFVLTRRSPIKSPASIRHGIGSHRRTHADNYKPWMIRLFPQFFL